MEVQMKKFLVEATIVAGLAVVGCNKATDSTVPATTGVAITTDSGVVTTATGITTEQAITEEAVTTESSVK